MNRLQKFAEQGDHGEHPGRVAYAFTSAALPKANPGLTWRPVADFSAAEEVLNDRRLKQLFETAIKHGVAIIHPNV
jgi:hypothetical protein